MGCLIQSESQNSSNDDYQKEKSKKFNRVIGGNSNQQLSQNELIAQAAERRLQNYEKRGLTPQSQIEFEQKKKKQEEYDMYKQEERQTNYKWD